MRSVRFLRTTVQSASLASLFAGREVDEEETTEKVATTLDATVSINEETPFVQLSQFPCGLQTALLSSFLQSCLVNPH